MLNYKELENNIHAFEDDVKEDFLNKKIEKLGLISITDEEENAIRKQKDIDNQVVEKSEYSSLKYYLSSTDWVVAKCYELELTVSEQYPEIYKKRVEARARINELEKIIGETNED